MRKEIYLGGVISLGLETLLLPNGECLTLEIARHPGGAAILALDQGGRICLLRQYRHAIEEWIWEIPAGVIEKGEEAISTAKRELREEASLEADECESLSSIIPTPGFCNEQIFLFRAWKLRSVKATPNADEQIEVHWKSLDEALDMATKGTIRDAKTIVALFRAIHPNQQDKL